MKSIRFRIVFGFFVFMMVMNTAGCEKKVVDKRTVIRFFNPQGISEEIKMMEEIVNKFEKDNPDIKVKIESGGTPDKLLVEIAGGMPPDVFLSWTDWGPMAEKDTLLELDTYIERHHLNLNDYFPCAIGFSKYKGKSYVFPVNLHIPVAFYNKDMFDKAGIPYPNGSWTWNEYYETAVRLTDRSSENGIRTQFGTQLGNSAYFWILQNKGQIFDRGNKRSNIKSEEAIEALRFAYKLYSDASPSLSEMKTFSGVGDVNPFITGKIGMLIQTGAYIGIFSQQINNFRWDIAPLPIPPHSKRVNIISADYLGIPRGSKHPEEAFRFLKYYCGRKGMEVFISHKRFILPYREMAYETFVPPPENIKLLINILEEPYIFNPLTHIEDERWFEMMTHFWDGWELILSGNISFDEGIDKMEIEMNRRLEQIWR